MTLRLSLMAAGTIPQQINGTEPLVPSLKAGVPGKPWQLAGDSAAQPPIQWEFGLAAKFFFLVDF